MTMQRYDVIVIGGGHAGIEAAAAASRMGCSTLLAALDRGKIGELSCNPAIGGIGKGQLVKEVDALGGLMGELADLACIQYRLLNTTRGAAVQSTRMQVDRDVYPRAAQARLADFPNLEILEDEALALEPGAGRSPHGVVFRHGGKVACKAVVLAVGTFFHGLIHMGTEQQPGGRLGDPPSVDLPENLRALGFEFGRFKTGTTPRLDRTSIRYENLTEQPGDVEWLPFSQRSPERPALRQISCYLGHTNETTHRLIRDHLHLSALYSGQITATGVRYCPSVEDKIVKFPERDRHHVFVEPEGLNSDQVYPNGLSNSLPPALQEELVHSVVGLEQARILVPGYGIEHDYLDPTQLRATLEAKRAPGIFFAGQINGTTGYEEAAAQGLVAGINAARRAQERELLVLDRSRAYIGVLIDDLVTKGTQEPYRMFTSRVEYRLVLREDNADERLTPLGRDLGLISQEAYRRFQAKQDRIASEWERIGQTRLRISGGEPVTILEWMRRPENTYQALSSLDPESGSVPAEIRRIVEIQVKYEGYIRRQMREIEMFQDLERIRIPEDFVYQGLPGLSREVVEKLTRFQPHNLGQAGRISGITPGALSQLVLHLRKKKTHA